MKIAHIQENNKIYWDAIADVYHDETEICVTDFHYGPMVPGDSVFKLLPDNLEGLKCYEFGSGAAQNSIFLASKGAKCYASDISSEQLLEAARIISYHEVEVEVELIHAPMEKPLPAKHGKCDLVHSSYALAFSSQPEKTIINASKALKKGGSFIFSTGHPLFSGEWLEIDGEEGLFIKDYFKPEPDIRYDDLGNEAVRAQYYSIGTLVEWIAKAGLVVEKIIEPKPVNIEHLKKDEIMAKVPYFSHAWCDYFDQLLHYPIIIIFKCRKV